MVPMMGINVDGLSVSSVDKYGWLGWPFRPMRGNRERLSLLDFPFDSAAQLWFKAQFISHHLAWVRGVTFQKLSFCESPTFHVIAQKGNFEAILRYETEILYTKQLSFIQLWENGITFQIRVEALKNCWEKFTAKKDDFIGLWNHF